MLEFGRVVLLFLFCFKQKTAYEMRISDWSSDVCSSDLVVAEYADLGAGEERQRDVTEDFFLRRHDLADAIHRVNVLGHGALEWTTAQRHERRGRNANYSDRRDLCHVCGGSRPVRADEIGRAHV